MLAQLLLIAALPVEITVELAGDDACRFGSRVPDSLRRVFPGLRVILAGEAEGRDEAARMRLRINARDRAVQIELDDGAKVGALVRELPSAPEACAATADGIALVVERYLRDLGYEPTSPPLPAITTATIASPAPVVPPPAIVEPEPMVWTLEAGARPIFSMGLGATASPFVEVGGAIVARLGVGALLELTVEGGHVRYLSPVEVERADRETPFATIRASAWFAAIGPGACVALSGAMRLCGGVRVGREWASGTVEPLRPLGRPGPDPGWTSHILVIPEARLDLRISAWLAVFAGAGAWIRGDPGGFVVESAQPAYQLPPASPSIALGARATIF